MTTAGGRTYTQIGIPVRFVQNVDALFNEEPVLRTAAACRGGQLGPPTVVLCNVLPAPHASVRVDIQDLSVNRSAGVKSIKYQIFVRGLPSARWIKENLKLGDTVKVYRYGDGRFEMRLGGPLLMPCGGSAAAPAPAQGAPPGNATRGTLDVSKGRIHALLPTDGNNAAVGPPGGGGRGEEGEEELVRGWSGRVQELVERRRQQGLPPLPVPLVLQAWYTT